MKIKSKDEKIQKENESQTKINKTKSENSFNTIRNIDEKLEIIEEIGEGSFGKVYKGKLGIFFVAVK